MGRRRHRGEPAARRRARRGRRQRPARCPAAGRIRRREVTDRLTAPEIASAPTPTSWSPAAPGSSAASCVRQILARRDGTRVTVLDKLTYAGNRANLAAVEADAEQAGALRVRPGRHRRPGRRRAAGRRRGRRGQRRRRDARRPLDPRPGGVPAHRRHRGPRPARGGPPRGRTHPGRRAPVAPRFLQVSTDEVYGDIARGPVRRDRRPRPAQPVRRRQGLERAARPRLPRDVRARRRDHARLEHLRPVPAPREAHPAVRHQRPRRRAAADVRRRDAGPRLAPRRPTTRRGSSSCSATASRARPTTWPARTSGRTARSSGSCWRPPAATGRWSAPCPIGPGTTAGTRWTARRPRRSAGGRRSRSSDGPARHRRLVSRPRRRGSRPRDRGDWDAYYDRQYGDRLAAGQAVDEAG